MKYLFVIFIVLPIIEISVLIEVGSHIGTLNTAGLVVLTALIGSLMLRQQGLDTLFRARERLQHGQLPVQEMLEGLCLAVGGALLVTPGFVTDAIGFLCLMPWSRRWLAGSLAAHVTVGTVNMTGFDTGHGPDNRYRSHRPHGDVFEGEYQNDNAEPINKLESKESQPDETSNKDKNS